MQNSNPFGVCFRHSWVVLQPLLSIGMEGIAKLACSFDECSPLARSSRHRDMHGSYIHHFHSRHTRLFTEWPVSKRIQPTTFVADIPLQGLATPTSCGFFWGCSQSCVLTVKSGLSSLPAPVMQQSIPSRLLGSQVFHNSFLLLNSIFREYQCNLSIVDPAVSPFGYREPGLQSCCMTCTSHWLSQPDFLSRSPDITTTSLVVQPTF